jgi:hypothetical protein
MNANDQNREVLVHDEFGNIVNRWYPHLVKIGEVPFKDLRPTGKCFDDALDWLWYQAKGLGKNSIHDAAKAMDYKLVHGVCLAPVDRKPFAHAWIQKGKRTVINSSTLFGTKYFITWKRDEFEKTWGIQEKHYYSLPEALEMNHIQCSYGPWLPHLLNLCKPRKKSS